MECIIVAEIKIIYIPRVANIASSIISFVVEDNLYDVVEELTPLAAKWKAIGRALRLKSGDLDRIEFAHPGRPRECLSDVILMWLKKNYRVEKYGQPTWQKIVEIVANSAGGDDAARAKIIASKHQKTTASPDEGTCICIPKPYY